MSVQFAAARTSLGSIRSISAPSRSGARSVQARPSADRPAGEGRQTPEGPLKLTRRGRLLLVGAPILLGGAALLTFVGFFTAPALASSDGAEVTRTQQVSVSTGDSLWSLASQYAPERDPRAVVADIMELNNLSDAVVPAGVQLYIPVAG
ncbi:LysM peptidoglycan-binding domain-containing protein [Arthrobacter koreensis]|uniref:LysM peptidoglycan-binding domain-containing protein n=1 Tax=Arthrobacter koreensis TaxID=199136 RepID=UPI002DB7F91C|nr:LysM peptidoglycan-binding domain-containing protein [Arthrobacter koreensis]MEB7505904.1 LysM peptidoglycan-binding domain-containing protein [Arthrobacter koreensis]